MIRIICFSIFLLPVLLFGQTELFLEKDTMRFSSRTGGMLLDSVDLTNAASVSTFSGGSLNTQNNVISPQFLIDKPGLQNFRNQTTYKPMKFSGAPHLGFAYSFGSKGTQFLHADFQQVLPTKILLNINYDRKSSVGFMRNSTFNDNVFSLQLRKNGRFYSYLFESNYSTRLTGLNGGATSFENTESQGLEFLPVLNLSANSTVKSGTIKLNNYFNVLNDSIPFLFLVTKHQYEILNREFIDNQYVKNGNIDSLSTRDQYRIASIKTAAGIAVKRKAFLIDFTVQHRYWDYLNLAKHRDTNEINLTSALQIKRNRFEITNDANVNLIGAGGEWSSKSSLKSTNHKIDLLASLQVEQKWPEAFQRFYFSNYYSYKLPTYQLQNRLFTTFSANYNLTSSNLVQLTYANAVLQNNYLFIDTTWRNDTLTKISINSFSANGSFTFKKLTFQPKVTISIPSKNFNYIPQTAFNARLFLKKRMFKAKKLEGMYGVDFSWVSSYKLMNYNNQLDVFIVSTTANSFHSMSNLSAFFGFSLGEFRFYARYENIGYFWNDKTNQVLNGFPIQKNFFRLGITWDFFN